MIGRMWTRLAVGALLALNVQPAMAQGKSLLTSKVELENSIPSTNGGPATKTYIEPETVVPGDRIRITLTFTNKDDAPASDVILLNPVPQALAFEEPGDSAGFSVSIDGMTYGALGTLTVAVPNAAPRRATAADVTHVRWQWPDAIAPGQSRSVAFFGRVR